MRPAAAALVGVILFALAGSAGAGEAPAESLFIGDTDCDGRITSIDASLVLQYGAALTESLPCGDFADVSWDGRVDSADAALVLQKTAHLIPGFIRMSVAVTRPAGACDDPVRPTECTVAAGAEFGLSISLDNPPPEGYIGIQTRLYYDHLRYNVALFADEEVVWPDGTFVVRSSPEPGALPTGTEGTIAHGAATTALAPFRISSYAGELVVLSVTCPQEPQAYPVALVSISSNGPLGSGVRLPDETTDDLSRVAAAQHVETRDLDLNLDGLVFETEQDLPLAAALTVNCV